MEQDKPKRQKTGGRKAGTPNKVTAEQKSRVEEFFSCVWTDFMTNVYPQLSPKDQKDTVVALMPYVCPKLSSVDVRQENKTGDSALEWIKGMMNDSSII